METQMEQVLPVKCRKCRFTLFTHPEVHLQDSHGSSAFNGSSKDACSSDVWYIPEEMKPIWLNETLAEKGWEKGKLVCPKCSGRIGSYNFVSGMRCACSKYVLPPIHLVKSKVDVTMPVPVLLPS